MSASCCRGRGRCARTCSASAGSCENSATSRQFCTRSCPAARPRSIRASAGGSTMLSGKLVRVRQSRNRLHPQYIDVNDPKWRDVAERLLQMFRTLENCTRDELEEEIRDAIGDNPTQLVHQGLAKLL